MGGFLAEKRYLIHDRDPLFTAEFLSTLAAAGVKSAKLPPICGACGGLGENRLTLFLADPLQPVDKAANRLMSTAGSVLLDTSVVVPSFGATMMPGILGGRGQHVSVIFGLF